MSARNGDKSRFHRLRKAKIRRRIRTELLRSLVTTEKQHPAEKDHAAPAVGAPHASEPRVETASEPTAETASEKPAKGPLAAAAQTIGGVLGAVAAKTGIAHKPESNPAE